MHNTRLSQEQPSQPANHREPDAKHLKNYPLIQSLLWAFGVSLSGDWRAGGGGLKLFFIYLFSLCFSVAPYYPQILWSLDRLSLVCVGSCGEDGTCSEFNWEKFFGHIAFHGRIDHVAFLSAAFWALTATYIAHPLCYVIVIYLVWAVSI